VIVLGCVLLLDALVRMLRLNKDEQDNKDSKDSAWKVLVYDRFCQDILAPLLNVTELRKYGITLNMLITTEREPVPDVPAIYFVQPTRENIDRITRDCSANLYHSFFLNFSTSLSRDLLETLAQQTLQHNCSHKISKVFDQYSSFVALQEKVISLNMPQAYYTLHKQQSDEALVAFLDVVVTALFSVVVTLGCVPIIRCKRGEAAEMVASQLYQKLKDHLRSRTNLFTESEASGVGALRRPIMVLLDRSVDLTLPLYHPWTYQALVHDVLDMKSNVVTLPVEKDGKTIKERYELVVETDEFWRINAGLPFPRFNTHMGIIVSHVSHAYL
jgi:hypothetical protein